jgi:surface protein
MSFRNVQQNSIDNRNTLSVPPYIAASGTGTSWIRNPSWLTMPAITSANVEVDMLVPIYPESNFIAFNFSTSAGTYSVDWGDGTSGTFTSGVAAQKQYDYTTAALDGTNAPVTFQQSGSTVTRTSHGYTNGNIISFASITTTTGITATQIYYVINATTNTFQLAATLGGTALTLTNDGTGIILPYKQAIIKVTPTTGGATLTTVNLQVKNTTVGLQAYAQPVMDLTISAACTSLTIQGASPVVPMNILEQCTILRHNTINFTSLFENNKSLQSVNITNATATEFINMFKNATGIQRIASFNNTANGGNMLGMFSGCTSLQAIPLINTTNVTNMTQTFFGCSSLQTIPLLNTSNVTSMQQIFSNCPALQYVPLLNTSKVINMGGAFAVCNSLTTVPIFNTANVSNMAVMFQGCTSINTIPLFNTINVANMQNFCNNASSLQSVPLLNTSNVTLMINAFQNCYALTSVPLLNTSNVISVNAMFNNCTSLQTVPAFNTANVIDFGSMLQTCTALQTVPAFNTINATSTAAMFQSCRSLQSVPLLNTSNVTNMTSMFNDCNTLGNIPLYDTGKVTNMSTMFQSCNSLKNIPALNTSNVTTATSMFNAAGSLQTIPTLNTASLVTTTTMFGSGTSISSIGGLTNLINTVSVINLKLSGPALDVIYTSLGKVAGSCTFQATPTNTVTITGHGYTNGDSIRFSVITTTTGISTNTTYWVRNVTTDTFQLSATPTGAILTLTNNGTGTRAPATITVSGNWGIATDTPSIATAKGWTVTGS